MEPDYFQRTDSICQVRVRAVDMGYQDAGSNIG